MSQVSGKTWVSKWKARRFWACLISSILYALATSLFVSALIGYFYPLPWWFNVVLFLPFFAGYTALLGLWKITLWNTAFMLDAKFPELEYSTTLFLKTESSLGLLQQLQQKKIAQRLPTVDKRREERATVLRKPLFCLLFGLLIYSICHYFTPERHGVAVSDPAKQAQQKLGKRALPAAISRARLAITPPTYTGLPKQQQEELAIAAISGSTIEMHLFTNKPMPALALLFDGKNRVAAERVDSLEWIARFKPKKNGFYQIDFGEKAMPLYPIELLPDQPVTIRLVKPDASRTVIEAGFQPVSAITAHLLDDYGIRDASLVLTISSGKGESVSFTSKEIDLAAGKASAKAIDVKREMNLKSLAMKPGDELYFYIRAHDYTGQESRSDVYVTAWQDTTELMRMSGMASGSDIAPEYFRSERQIIIDIEKLLEESPGLGKEEVHNRSANLGVDQKLLRLRYGQFLGEEEESGEAHHEENEGQAHADDDDHDVGVDELVDQLTHHHDQAEDATFFTPEQKAQLKAVLTEMWNAELKLRTFMPQQALPYAYKALRLLKDLQQQSRTYVAKAPSKGTPLKLEKRLTGDLSEITEPTVRVSVKEEGQQPKQEQSLRLALARLSEVRKGERINDPDRQLLGRVEERLIEGATIAPERYLGALKALRELEESGSYQVAAVEQIAAAVQALLPNRSSQPDVKQEIGKESIYNRYLRLIRNSL